MENERFWEGLSYRSVPTPRRRAIGWQAAVCAFLLAVAGIGAWWLVTRPSSPEQAVRQFLEAAKTGSYSKMSRYLSKGTVNAIGQSAHSRLKFVHGWQELLTGGYEDARDAEFSLGDTDDNTTGIAVVPVELVADGDRVLTHIRDYYPEYARVPIVMVQEGGSWKFDAGRTIDHLVINAGYCEDNGCLTD